MEAPKIYKKSNQDKERNNSSEKYPKIPVLDDDTAANASQIM